MQNKGKMYSSQQLFLICCQNFGEFGAWGALGLMLKLWVQFRSQLRCQPNRSRRSDRAG